MTCLRDIGHPIIEIHTNHEGLKTAEASTEDAASIYVELNISLCRIILTEPLDRRWTRTRQWRIGRGHSDGGPAYCIQSVASS
jgi:hypothetical protein